MPKIVPITVESTALDLGQLKLWLYGDVNGDGAVDIKDVTALLRHVAEVEALSPDAAALGNVNGDSSVDVKDVTKLLRYVSEIIPDLD